MTLRNDATPADEVEGWWMEPDVYLGDVSIVKPRSLQENAEKLGISGEK